MNKVSTQLGSIGNKIANKRGCGEANKFDSIIYHCFIYGLVEHKTYDYLHKDAAQAMFREKTMAVAPKEDDVAINMVLAITTHNEIPENVVFKQKKPRENNNLANKQAEEKLQ